MGTPSIEILLWRIVVGLSKMTQRTLFLAAVIGMAFAPVGWSGIHKLAANPLTALADLAVCYGVVSLHSLVSV
jgi:hypothetical protein